MGTQVTQPTSPIESRRTALSPNSVHEAAADAEQIKSVRDRLGTSIDYLEGISNLGDVISEVCSFNIQMLAGGSTLRFHSSIPL